MPSKKSNGSHRRPPQPPHISKDLPSKLLGDLKWLQDRHPAAVQDVQQLVCDLVFKFKMTDTH